MYKMYVLEIYRMLGMSMLFEGEIATGKGNVSTLILLSLISGKYTDKILIKV